jgi:hypothetical protein
VIITLAPQDFRIPRPATTEPERRRRVGPHHDGHGQGLDAERRRARQLDGANTRKREQAGATSLLD